MAAPLVLASDLLALSDAASEGRPRSAPTGCSAIDQALDGGFRYGEIASISGLEQSGKSLVTMHAAACHLLHDRNAQVAFIDSTGSFSAVKLKGIIASQQARYPAPRAGAQAEDVAQCLGRVRIMRVFDLAGASESVQEIASAWGDGEPPENADLKRAMEIRSSQDDEDELEIIPAASEGATPGLEPRSKKFAKMIIVDHASNIVSREFSHDQIEGQARFSDFQRELREQTVQLRAATILINQAVKPYHAPGAEASSEQEPHPATSRTRPIIPGLGVAYLRAVDLSLLVLPMAGSRDGGTILEVLHDRLSDRTGLHGAFRVWRQQLISIS